MRLFWKRTLLVVADLVLAVYLVLAVTRWNVPDASRQVCAGVQIDIADESPSGFITAQEIKTRLQHKALYPIGKRTADIDVRRIEEALTASPFVNTAECCKTIDGNVHITITQRLPVIRIKAENGDDYYLDDHHAIMPNSHYTSDLVIATGAISRDYARAYLAPLGEMLLQDALWNGQIEQINILPDRGVELVPRVGAHIIYIGQLPLTRAAQREQAVCQYVRDRLDRLELFYKHGLSKAGWNRYEYINLEFDNQIICKRRAEQPEPQPEPQPAAPEQQQTQAPEAHTEDPVAPV